MKLAESKWVKRLGSLLGRPAPEPEQQGERIVAMQLHIVLPAKAGVMAVILYYLFHQGWFDETPSPLTVVIRMLRTYFFIYLVCNLVAVAIMTSWRRFPPGIFQWLVFTLGLLDGLFMAGVTFLSGGFEENVAFWIFPGLIVLNSISIPLATPQLVLNFLLSIFYLSAGVLTTRVSPPELWTPPPGRLGQPATRLETSLAATNAAAMHAATAAALDGASRLSRTNLMRRGLDLPYSINAEEETESLGTLFAQSFPRIFVLWLLTVCCYGVQLLTEQQRRTMEEEREFAVREVQLRSAGRLAAEFAHQIKNPLAIINNAAYSMQRALKEGRNDVARQIEIIQEEVERSDRIVTQIMGYAQLTEGRVEKLNVLEELDRAIDQVFPAAVEHGIQVERRYATEFPPLLMQRRHFSEIVVNLLQNAREALNGAGRICVTALVRREYAIEVTIEDNGPGIAPDKLERIFEAYYTTREKGTGLGLAIVKHNVELYTGTVRVESGLGKGARFILNFPAKTAVRLT